MDVIFDIVAASLMLISYITGLTYVEINIIIYYMAVPFVYAALIDRIFKKHYLKVLFLVGVTVFFLSVKDFRAFSERLFELSVVFLKGFSDIGWDYVTASVVICVVIPGTLFVYLAYKAYHK